MSEALTEVEVETAENGEIVLTNKKESNQVQDSFGATPLEDRHGRHLWVRTRLCYCPKDAETDCRFHSTKEKGWEECPSLKLMAKVSSDKKNSKGKWLWARNPDYGKPMEEETTVAELTV